MAVRLILVSTRCENYTASFLTMRNLNGCQRKTLIDMSSSSIHSLVQVERPSVQHGSQVLVSAEINGEINYYNLSGNSIDDIMKVAKTVNPLVGYADIGSRISGEEYAELMQSADFLSQ